MNGPILVGKTFCLGRLRSGRGQIVAPTIVLSYRKLLEFSCKAVAAFNPRERVQSKCFRSVESFIEHLAFIYVYESEETRNGLPYHLAWKQ